MPRRRGKDANPQKRGGGTKPELQEDKHKHQAASANPASDQDYREQRRTGNKAVASARER